MGTPNSIEVVKLVLRDYTSKWSEAEQKHVFSAANRIISDELYQMHVRTENVRDPALMYAQIIFPALEDAYKLIEPAGLFTPLTSAQAQERRYAVADNVTRSLARTLGVYQYCLCSNGIYDYLSQSKEEGKIITLIEKISKQLIFGIQKQSGISRPQSIAVVRDYLMNVGLAHLSLTKEHREFVKTVALLFSV